MKQKTIIKRLKALALAKYNEGWDTFVECYDDADWLAFTTHFDTGEAMTWAEARAMAETCASVWHERQVEATRPYEEYLASGKQWPAADDSDDDSPREPLQFIPHASDYSIFD